MRIQTVKYLGLASLLSVSLISAGCTTMSPTDRRIGTGAGIGAVTGALIGGNVRSTAAGALIGAGAGWLYDRQQKKYYRYDHRGRRVYR